jgi:hypothetical protein
MTADFLPPELRHEAFEPLKEAYGHLQAAQISLEKAAKAGKWGGIAVPLIDYTRDHCRKAVREIEDLQIRAAKTGGGLAL